MMKTWVRTLASVLLSDNSSLVEAKHARMRAYPGFSAGVVYVVTDEAGEMMKSSRTPACALRAGKHADLACRIFTLN